MEKEYLCPDKLDLTKENTSFLQLSTLLLYVILSYRDKHEPNHSVQEIYRKIILLREQINESRKYRFRTV